MTANNSIKIQLLCVPDCPLVAKVRRTLERCLAETNIDAEVEVLVGEYASPTLLIDGVDVNGQPPAPEGQTACRLDNRLDPGS
ncbi:hypothetical protein BGZ61DRAFT_368475 [Ilyonectria robusta]|uniref:uncharacterized protein n=1 Tax=Ilyonectria robusta TaxID=1079257 RepID=UPI001E8CDF39|nr:uncharacterized protein BGZ61DRAFT_368475 [Ilyonectria robusta]KAH8662786.1 hypothetical protein BGZ61DRAFT_368475 [Ilyonectria robusta]